jgi:hypothetical protein
MEISNAATRSSSDATQQALAGGRHTEWEALIDDLEPLAGPLIEASAFQRLRSISFLGILSPRYHLIVNSPLFRRRSSQTLCDDGSRYLHSLHAAHIFLRICRRLDLSQQAQRYAVAWGIAHDIATWPLSHTGEPAFASVTGVTAKELRAMMVQGAPSLPDRLSLARALKQMAVDPGVLLALFDKQKRPADAEISILWEIVHSPITPDTLEGMWRSGLVFGITVPAPDEVMQCFSRNLIFPVMVTREMSTIVVEFWRRKAQIYDDFINRSDVIEWESAWAIALLRAFKHINLVESLEVPEEELVARVLEQGLPDDGEVAELRYKEPLVYFVEPRRKRMLQSDSSPLGLEEFLRKARRSG